MKMLRFTSFALAATLLANSGLVMADSRTAPPPPPVSGDDYADSYGYGANGAYPPPQGGYYGNGPQSGYESGVRDERSDNTKVVGGGVLGGAAGAVAGTFIAGHGSRLAGGLIGGGVGALAGLAIGALLTHKHHHASMQDGRGPALGYDYGVIDTNVMYHGHWAGTMTGSWNGGPVRTWQGNFDSENGQTHWRGRYLNDDGGHGGGYPYPGPHHRPMGYGPGYHYGYGYGGGMYEEMMIPSQPIITKTVTTRSYYVDVPVRTYRYVKRVWHPVCSCAVAPRPVWHPRPHPRPQRIMGS
jgi:hypothetical protein